MERLIRAGHLTKFSKEQVNNPPAEGPRDSLGPADGRVDSIAGGFELENDEKLECNAVHTARQLRKPFKHKLIIFTEADFEGVEPHHDDLVVVTLRVANYIVDRILIDQGSSADLIYGDAFEKMGFKKEGLQPYNGTLVGFTNQKEKVRGFVETEIVFGEGFYKRRVKVRYLVLECEASYNILIGRHTLNDVGAVVSTPHLKVKFPLTDGKIATIGVDQKLARQCYSESLDKYGHWGAQTTSGMPHMVEVAAHIEQEPPHHDSLSNPKDDFNQDPSQSGNRNKKTALGEQPRKGGQTYDTDQRKESKKVTPTKNIGLTWKVANLSWKQIPTSTVDQLDRLH